MSRELRLCPGVGGRKCGTFLSSLDRDPHPIVLGVRVKYVQGTWLVTFVVIGLRRSGNFLQKKKRSYKERKKPRHSCSLPPASETSPRAETPSGVSQPGTSSSSFSLPSDGQDKRGGGGPRVHLVLCPVRLPPLPLGLGLVRRGCVSGHWSVACERASVSSAPLGTVEGEVARSPLACSASLVASPRSSPHAR